MALHNTRGKEGETMAVEYLKQNDFEILACNWRHSHYEIDIIATKNSVLHVIEVKTRHNLTFGYPEESVSRKKFGYLKKAAEFFMRRYPRLTRVQFDIVAITITSAAKEFLFIEDVYL